MNATYLSNFYIFKRKNNVWRERGKKEPKFRKNFTAADDCRVLSVQSIAIKELIKMELTQIQLFK